MELTLSKIHLIFGFGLIIAGSIFDFAFITTTENFLESMKNNSASYLWTKYVYELVKSYMFILGFLNIALALIPPTSNISGQYEWIISGLMLFGSIFFIIGGLWEARIGPIFEMEKPCYVLGGGLIAIMLSLIIKIYYVLVR